MAVSSSSSSHRDHAWIYNQYDYITALKAVFGAVIMTANGLTLVGLHRARGVKRSLKLGLINLAITDFVAGLVFSYHAFAARYLEWNTAECHVRYAVVILVICATLCTLVMMSLDRLFALYLPYQYDAIVTNRNLYLWIAGNWLTAVVFAAVGIVETTDAVPECNFVANATSAKLWAYSLGSLGVVAVVLALQTAIFSAAIRQVRKIVPVMPSSSGAPHGSRKLVLQGLRMHMKATVTTGIVVLPFLLLTVPLFCFFCFLALHPHERANGVNLYLVDAGLFLVSLNSLVNPAIYIWRLSAVRGPLKQILCWRCCPQQAQSSSSSSN